MLRGLRRLLALLPVLLVAAPSPSRAAAADSLAALGVCASVWTRPDREIRDPRTCALADSPSDIARGGGIVLLGSSWDATAPGSRLRPRARCVPHTHEGNGELVRSVRAARRAGDPPVAFVQLHRFELVTRTQAALPGFRSSFLARAETTLDVTQRFFERDRSVCGPPDGCALSGSFRADPAEDDGGRLFDLIDAAGAPGDHLRAVYYLARPEDDSRVFWTEAAMGDLSNPAYRRFRVEEARRAVAVAGYDAIMLNQKFSQFRKEGGYWLGSPRVPDVAAILRQQRDMFWTSRPADLSYSRYVQGWAALGRELRAAGVPYAVWVGVGAWRSGRPYDDRTTSIGEDALVRETAEGARIVILQQPSSVAELARIERELRAAGVEAVVRGPGARNTCAGEGTAAAPHRSTAAGPDPPAGPSPGRADDGGAPE
jgi:hypothetical protein